MKLFGLIAGSVFFGLVIAASLKSPDPEFAKHQHFKKLEEAGRDRYRSYGGGI
jgi:hypothetical protein|tara:strand:- start:293 stop:451 length:159 start_codon:yes stop_codon:yes gene_type:complete